MVYSINLGFQGSNLWIEGGAVHLVVWQLLTAQDLRQFDHYLLFWCLQLVVAHLRSPVGNFEGQCLSWPPFHVSSGISMRLWMVKLSARKRIPDVCWCLLSQ